VEGDGNVPLTLSRDQGSESLDVVATKLQASAVGTLSRTRTEVDEPVLGEGGRAEPARPHIDIVDEWGVQSFPASDPPMNW
jgi:hypothetical protein